MSSKADAPLAERRLAEAAQQQEIRDAPVRRHFAVAEDAAAIDGLLLHHSLHNLGVLLRAGRV